MRVIKYRPFANNRKEFPCVSCGDTIWPQSVHMIVYVANEGDQFPIQKRGCWRCHLNKKFQPGSEV